MLTGIAESMILMHPQLEGLGVMTDTERQRILGVQNVFGQPAQSAVGIKYDAGKSRMELISPIAMEELGKVLAYGAVKYSDNNWMKGIAWSRVIGALLRHLYAYMRGERIDPESGLSHLAHVLCNAHFLVHYEKMRPEFDDLPKAEK